MATVQKYANFVELEKCCRTHIFLQNFVLIQPRTSPPKICKKMLFFLQIPVCQGPPDLPAEARGAHPGGGGGAGGARRGRPGTPDRIETSVWLGRALAFTFFCQIWLYIVDFSNNFRIYCFGVHRLPVIISVFRAMTCSQNSVNISMKTRTNFGSISATIANLKIRKIHQHFTKQCENLQISICTSVL